MCWDKKTCKFRSFKGAAKGAGLTLEEIFLYRNIHKISSVYTVLSYWITTVPPAVLCALGVVLFFNMEFLLLIVSLESSFCGNHRAQELEGVLKTYREEK